MYLSITNVGHQKTKYFIVDQTEELNIPNIPSGYTLAFQEKYTNNFKVLNDEELKQVFLNNTILYEILEFNSSFKITNDDAKKYIDDEFEELSKKFFKITPTFELNRKNLNIVDFIKVGSDIYTKNEVDNLFSILQNKINNINNTIDFINNNYAKTNTTDLNNLIESLRNDLIHCKEKAKLISMVNV